MGAAPWPPRSRRGLPAVRTHTRAWQSRTGRRSGCREAGRWGWKALGSLVGVLAHPSPSCLRSPVQIISPRTQYLSSWLQRWHKVFDHFGFRDRDPAHHEEDQERVVAGMRPAHLQNKPPPGSEVSSGERNNTQRDYDVLGGQELRIAILEKWGDTQKKEYRKPVSYPLESTEYWPMNV